MLAENGSHGAPDLSHHLSQEAKERLPNAMKTFFRSLQDAPALTSLANGDPHSSLYPLAQVDFHVPDVSDFGFVNSWMGRASGSSAVQKLSAFNRGEKSVIDLSVAMQYGTGLGLNALRDQLAELTRILHAPHETTRSICLSLGNADGVTKVYRLLGTPGDTFLADEYSFCGLTNAPIAQGIRWQPIKADANGVIPEDMERVLNTWDEAVRGRRPHVYYCIPTGQNPTGATMPLERRRAVYAIAQKYDIVILEDDPYHFLHFEENASTVESATNATPEQKVSAYMKGLVPSFLSMDVDGRVIRIDSVSKTIAPNMRLGWITSNALFNRKLEILIDNSTQHPGGLTQCLLAEMLGPSGWGMDGYLRWGYEIRNEYQRRRDLFFKIFQREIGARGHGSTVLPVAGMFFWIRIHIEGHPRFVVTDPAPKTGPKTNTLALMDELFQSCVKGGVLIMPGVLFAMVPTDKTVAEQASSENHILDRPFFRATFVGVDETIEKALGIFARVLNDFFQG